MAVYYLDTSALVKRYASETGTVWVMNLTEPRVGHDIYTVRVTGPEMIAALFRKAQTRQVSQAEAVRSAKNFRADWQMQYQVLEVTAGVVDRAMELAEKHGLRGYDSVHLAAALDLQEIRNTIKLPALTFVSADVEQLQVALSCGLIVENPDRYSEP